MVEVAVPPAAASLKDVIIPLVITRGVLAGVHKVRRKIVNDNH
jgi:hypothetical protein